MNAKLLVVLRAILFVVLFTVSHSVMFLSVLGISTSAYGQVSVTQNSPATNLPINRVSTQNMRFEHIRVANGLSQATVLSILQDNQGFMWFATQDGVNRFDGYDMQVFRKIPNDENSLSENYVNDLMQDSLGYLWMSTRNGLNRFDPKTNQFRRFFHDAHNPNSLSANWTFSLSEDRLGNIWIGTYEKGLNLYDPKTDKFIRYRHDPSDPYSLSDDSIYDIFVDTSGRMWVATRSGGVNLYSSEKDSFVRYQYDENDPNSISSNRVYRIFQHSDGTMWFATRGGGLNRFDEQTGRFIRYQHDDNDLSSISSDQVWSIVEDRQGNLLVGTFSKGLNILAKGSDKFVRFEQDPSNEFAIAGNSVVASFADSTGILWLAIRDVGVAKVNQDIGVFNHFYHSNIEKNSISGNSVQAFLQVAENEVLIATREAGINRFNINTKQFSLFHDINNPEHQVLTYPVNQMALDNKGNIWITFKEHGVAKYHIETAKVTHYQHDSNDEHSLSDNSVTTLVLGPQGKMWFGSRNGLSIFDPETEKFTRWYHNPDDQYSISSNWISYVYVDSMKRIWIATHNGLDLYYPHTGRFRHFNRLSEDPSSLSSNSVMSIYQDSHNQVWVATSSGVNRFDENTNTFTHLSKEEGLSNEQVYGLIEDLEGDLWITTNDGLNRYNPDSGKIKQYTVHDGLQNNEFNQGAITRLNDGRLMFGGVGGFNIFSPQDVGQDPYPPKVMLTNFRVFNQSVPVGEFDYEGQRIKLLDNSMSYTTDIDLTHDISVFSFEFSAMHYSASTRNEYAYRLLGFSDQWSYTNHKNRRATYTNLPAGHYTFEVKAANKDGLWGYYPAQTNITILAPWWLTRGMKFLWLALLFLSIYTIFRLKTRNIQQQKAELQVQVSRQVAQVVAQKRALERSYHDIKVISEIGQKINASLDLEKVLMSVYEHIDKLMDGTIFGIGICQPEKNQIQVELAIEKGVRYKPYTRSMENKEQFPVWCIDHDEVVFINDIELDGQRYVEHHEYETKLRSQVYLDDGAYAGIPQSLIYVPIRSTDKILGYITVQSFNKHAYQEVHVDILNTLAAYTGTAIINSMEHQRLIDSRKELLESEKMASLGMLVAGVAHEINTPVGICLTTASNLQRESEQLVAAKASGKLTAVKFDKFNQIQSESLNLLMNNLEKTSELISHFKDVVVNHAVEIKSRFNVRSLVEDTIETIQSELEQKSVTIELICDAELEANTYASSISRVISTLLMNSLLHAFVDRPKGHIIIYVCLAGSELQICYKDDGIGMDATLANQIFEPFYTTKRSDGCLGLGMHVVYNQVTQGLHGTVKCTSATGEGMQIDIHVPVQNY